MVDGQTPGLEPLLLADRVVGMTGLSKFEKCRRDYYLYRNHRKETHAMMRGIAFHGGIDRATAHMIEAGEPTMPGEVARDFVEGYIDDHPDLVVPENERDALRAMAWNWGEATVLDLEHLLGHEIAIQFELGGWLLRCRIDLVYGFDDHIEVEDYKTSLAMPTEESVQRDFQGKFYALACLEGFPDGQPFPLGAGLNDVNFRLIFPRFRDKEHGYLKFRGAAYDRKDLQDFKATLLSQLQQLERQYETQEWKATDGSHCERCTARALCPIPNFIHELPAITNVAEAETAASQLNQKKAVVAREQKGLRGWVAENGPVYFGDDLVMDLVARDSHSVKSWPNLEAAIKRAAELGEPFDLDQHRKKSTSTNFVKRKITEEERDA